MGDERRRAPRVSGELWVSVEGIDLHPGFVCGDFSVLGICFLRTTPMTELGSVEMLTIANRDRDISVRVLAQLVRAGSATHRATGERWPTAAFMFLPDTPEVANQLQRLYDRLVLERGAPQPAPPPPTSAHHITRMQVDASWPIAVGDKVQVVFQSLAPPNTRIPFEGVATRVNRGSTGYTADVELGASRVRTAFGVSSATSQPTITRSIDLVFTSDDIDTTDLPGATLHLAGRLDRISVPSLFSFFELERMSGELKIRTGEQSIVVYWLEGRPLDVDSDDGRPAREVIAALIDATVGTFRFVRKSVSREDKIQLSASALLLDLAREADEETLPE